MPKSRLDDFDSQTFIDSYMCWEDTEGKKIKIC